MGHNFWISVGAAILIVLINQVTSVCYKETSTTNLCPEGWNGFREICYKFKTSPRETQENALKKCQTEYGTLARIGDSAIHSHISKWIDTNVVNKSQKWYTAGIMDPANFAQYKWAGHRRALQDFRTELNSLWKITLPRPDQETVWPKTKKYIVYGSDGRSYGFFLETPDVPRPYICEMRKADVAKVGIQTRTYTFGVRDLNNIPLAPCLEVEPKSYLYFIPDNSLSMGSTKRIAPGENIAQFSCEARGNPRPTYRWYVVDTTSKPHSRTSIDPTKAPYAGRFSVTDGLLVINFPKVTDPSGEKRYQCVVSNSLGTVLSNQATLTFGQMARFSNTPRAPKRIDNFKQAALSCDPPEKTKPSRKMVYTFFKVVKTHGSTSFVPILPSTRPMVFQSQSGVLFFSAVTEEDSGYYVCMVTMKDAVGGSSQKSPEMQLIVNTGVTNVQKIDLHTGFPKVIPNDPFRGETIRLECFADGNAQPTITYKWERVGKKLSARARLQDLNRVIIIANADLDDEGKYKCTATQAASSGSSGGEKSGIVNVQLNAVPYFITRLKNKYVDKDATVKLICEASGRPKVTYKWLKGDNYIANAGSFAINTKDHYSELTITKITEENSGTYGCEISNTYGTSYSYAWVKVTWFAPNFDKYPVENKEGMIGQNFIYECRAEGAPNPVKSWFKNGAPLSANEVSIDVNTGEAKCGAKYCVYKNGNLWISKLAATDAGNYTCEAKSQDKSARSSGVLQVMPAPLFTLVPENRRILVNTTVDIPCLAQSEAHLDINYAWFFESHRLRFDRLDLDARRYDNARLLRPYGRNFGSLRIENVQFENEGRYVCELTTPIGKLRKTAWIRVAGPPGQCAGVQATPVTNSSKVSVRWTRGSAHNSQIKYYIIEAAATSMPDNWTKVGNLNELKDASTLPIQIRYIRRASVGGLAANTTYVVRVKAVNDLGVGEASPKSSEFTTNAQPPFMIPQNVTGGGGKRSTLVVRWNSIPRAFYNGPNFKYIVQYKKPVNRKWTLFKVTPEKAKALDINRKYLQYTITLPEGTKDYQPYDVQVGSENSKGGGPFSPSSRIYSSEAVPRSTPGDVVASAFNSTALMVRWKRPQANEGDGKIEGYRIVYWPRVEKCSSRNKNNVNRGIRQTIHGNVDHGLIIGLDPDQYYCIAAQVFNQAGDGPESGIAEQTTYKNAPTNYPTLVKLKSTGRPNEIKVSWVGIYTLPQEESLDGYRIRYWLTGAPTNNFKEVDVGLNTHGYLENLAMNTRYDLRVYGYSRGGVGEMSSPLLNFMIEAASKCIPGYWDGPDKRYVFFCSSCQLKTSFQFTLLCVISSLLFWLLH